MSQPNKAIYVQQRRFDGKFKVTYVFPISGVRLTKIKTREQIEAERYKGYDILGLPEKG